MIPLPLAVFRFLDPYLGEVYVLLGLHSSLEKNVFKGVLVAIVCLTLIATTTSRVRAHREGEERKRKGERKYGTKKNLPDIVPLEPEEKKGYAEGLIERGETLAAGKIFEELRQTGSAASAYKKGHHWLELGQMYERMNSLAPAAEAYKKADRPREAAVAYMKAGDFLHAGEMFIKIEFYDKAGQAFEKAGKFIDAAKAYERWYLTTTNPGDEGLGVLKRAGSLYGQAGLFDKAIPLLERAGALVEAGRACAQVNDYVRAADFLLRAGKKKEALEALRRVGDKERILQLEADILSTEGAFEEAAKRYQLLKDHYEAAELYRKAGKLAEAAAQYEEGGDFLEAAEANEGAGNLEHAWPLCLKAGRPSQAAALLARLGRPLQAAELYLKADEPVQAAQSLITAGSPAKAVQLLQKLPRTHHQHKQAAPLLGHLLVEAEEYVQAKAVLMDFLGGQPVNEETREGYMDLARAHDGIGERTAYLEQLYRIQSLDPENLDIRGRIDRCKSDMADEGGRARETPPGIVLGPADAQAFDLPAGIAQGELPRRYEVVEQLGAGGLGEVYKAKDSILDRMVAIKFLRNLPSGSSQAGRFLREARAAARFNHPNIVTVYDVGLFEGIAYIVMEYVEGETARALISRLQRVPVAQAVAIIRQVSAALAAAHGGGLIHRDVKPDNILLGTRGEAKLTDFGIVHVQEQILTGPGSAVGTVRYMSPEQIQGETIDGRSDLYALGVTLYEMITGGTPFSKGDISYQHVHQPPPPPHERNPGIPPEVESLVLKLLAKDPADRYPSAEELRQDLSEIQQRIGD